MDQDDKKRVEEIIGKLKCPKDFQCYKSGLENLCKAKEIRGTVSYLECLEKNSRECIFSVYLSDWDAHFCACPLRIYIAEKLKK